MRLVLDCDVLVAAARTDGTCREVVLAVVRRHDLIVSTAILDEYVEVGQRPKHRLYGPRMAALVEQLAKRAIVVAPAPCSFRLPDPDDEIYLAAAMAGDARALVTGNHRHFPEPRYGSVAILSPRAFLQHQGEASAGD